MVHSVYIYIPHPIGQIVLFVCIVLFVGIFASRKISKIKILIMRMTKKLLISSYSMTLKLELYIKQHSVSMPQCCSRKFTTDTFNIYFDI